MELYFHIPFCERKCFYCDFLSAPADEATKAAYMEAMRQETVLRAQEYLCTGEPLSGRDGERLVTSVFIGGGTPSTVEAEEIVALLATVRAHYPMAADAEITIEVNPGTVDAAKLSAYKKAGINRLSIGLQSADDAELAAIGRIHTGQQFLDTYRLAVKTGFSNINIDIMSTLPGQTVESYCDTLKEVLSLCPPPTHISAYSLILEEGTVFWERWQRGELLLPDEDADRLMYHETKRILAEAGYERYEISNYAKPGLSCRHNCGYWKREEYVGFGIGAASLFRERRFRNTEDIRNYLKNPADCREELQLLSREEQIEETLFLGLRMTEGISEREFVRRFGQTLTEVYGKVIKENLDEGLLEWRQEGEAENEGRLVLTERGLDVSNYVMAQFLLT